MTNKIIKEALTFDDVSLIPRKSSILPSEVSLKTQLTKNISLNIPFFKLSYGYCYRKPNGNSYC